MLHSRLIKPSDKMQRNSRKTSEAAVPPRRGRRDYHAEACMKVAELRALLTNTDTADLVKIISELYKNIPKAIKEDNDIDNTIKSIINHTQDKKTSKTTPIDYKTLHDEIQTFIENAYEGYYYTPNKIVPKQQRSKWRFAVMRFLKEIQKISNTDKDYDESNLDLIDIYKLLCYSTGYYTFLTQYDAFVSLHLNQSDLYKIICSRVFYKKIDTDMLSTMIDMSSKVELDGETLYINLIRILIEYLCKGKYIETAISLADEKIANPAISKKGYYLDRYIENLATLIMGLFFKIEKYNKGCAYYWNTCEKNKIHIYERSSPEDKKEILFYRFLSNIHYFTSNNEIWIKMYEKYSVGIKPRDGLVKEYEDIKKEFES